MEKILITIDRRGDQVYYTLYEILRSNCEKWSWQDLIGYTITDVQLNSEGDPVLELETTD